jgi:hypothetical protein
MFLDAYGKLNQLRLAATLVIATMVWIAGWSLLPLGFEEAHTPVLLTAPWHEHIRNIVTCCLLAWPVGKMMWISFGPRE